MIKLRDLDAKFIKIVDVGKGFPMIKLRDLDAKFIKIVDERTRHFVDTLAEAQGIMFLCPKCYRDKGCTSVGTHSEICWFAGRGVPDSESPGPGRWMPQGTGIDDLTFVPYEGHPACSVLNTSGCKWHGFIQNGHATIL